MKQIAILILGLVIGVLIGLIFIVALSDFMIDFRE